MITVYTVNLGGYDNLRPPTVVERGVRYVCYSDKPARCEPWEIQPAPLPYPCFGRNSRLPKILAHLFIDTEYSIYHDGCLQMAMRPSDLIAEMGESDLALYRHPCRNSVYEERDACKRLDIGYSPEMESQVERYRGHGLGGELWAGGVVVRRHTDLVAMFNEAWWREYRDGCARDQFALAFARYSVGLHVTPLSGNILEDSARFHFQFHADFIHLGDNAQYVDQRQEKAERERRLRDLL